MMPIIRFLGFADGDTVSLSATQNGASDSATLTNWNRPDGATGAESVSIEVVRAPSEAQYAPEAVWFYASVDGFDLPPAPANSIEYDPAFHEVEYEWDFGDPGDRFDTPSNLLEEHRDANSAVGPYAAHVFRGPGTYTVTCTARRVTDAETFAVIEVQQTVDVVVGDPASIFDATNTIVVAPDGDFSGAPASNHQVMLYQDEPSSWQQRAKSTAIPSGMPLRILFKRGFDYTPGNDDGFSHRQNVRPYSFIHYGAWGTGDKPTCTQRTVSRDFAAPIPQVWQDLVMQGTYDAVTEQPDTGFVFSTDANSYSLLTGCELRRSGGGLYHLNRSQSNPSAITLHDCAIYEHKDYGIWHFAQVENWDGNGHKHRLAILGTAEYDIGDQPGGLGSANGQKQGPLRGMLGEDLFIQGCEFFCRIGWTGQGNWPDGVNMTAVQPTLRFAAGQPTDGTQRNGDVVVIRCTHEGGGFVDKNVPGNEAPAVRNSLFEQNILIAVPTATSFAKVQNGATTWRNNLHIKPVVPGTPGIRQLLEVSVSPRPPELYDETQRRAEPVRIYNNTFMILDDSVIDRGAFENLDDYTTYLDENNVIHVVGNPGFERHEELAPYSTTELWPSRYLGRREWNAGVLEELQTQYETPAGTISLYRPLMTSSVVGAATGTLAYSDLLGTPRSVTQSRGAVEP